MMTVYILYNQGSPTQRWAEDMAKRLELEQIEPELLDADSPRGIQMVETYDIMGRPAVVVLKEDGAPMQVWQDLESMPPVSEIAYLARQ